MKATLEVTTFPKIHTGETIVGVIRGCLDDWGLDIARLARIVRDNASNMIKACKYYVWINMGCLAHSLHLVVHGALSKTKTEIQKDRDDLVLTADGCADHSPTEEDLDFENDQVDILDQDFTGMLDEKASQAP